MRHDHPPIRLRAVAPLDLARFHRPTLPGQRGLATRAAWYATSALLFRSTLPARLPSALKARILRAFGATIGTGFVCRPRVTIKHPWLLDAGDHVWIGEGAWIDNTAPVRLGSHVCVSQGAYLGTGNHDWTDPAFAYGGEPITVGDHVWITAFAIVLAGTEIPPCTAVLRR
jgi:putative colanic acid biosynthesis acetyltransferase WcaF